MPLGLHIIIFLPFYRALKVSEEAFRQAVSAKQATTLAADEAYSVSRDVFFQLLQPLHVRRPVILLIIFSYNT